MISLADIETGKECVVIKVHGHGGFRNRVMELGFVRGQRVVVIKNAPMRDPIEYQVMESRISLRRSEARQVEVMSIEDYNKLNTNHDTSFAKCSSCESCDCYAENPSKTINIALVGNPNCGKTTLFNKATGEREKTGNYAGVTVGLKRSCLTYKGYKINLIDLPGTYSMTEYSSEEKYVRHYLNNETPDVIINVTDATNLERNLYLTTQLVDMNLNTVMALNMYDELVQNGSSLDYDMLSDLFGFPVVPTIANKGEGLSELWDAAIDTVEGKDRERRRHVHVNYGTTTEKYIAQIKREIDKCEDIKDKHHTRYLSINLLESDAKSAQEILSDVCNQCGTDLGDSQKFLNKISAARVQIEREFKDDVRSVITSARYGFVRGALAETMRRERNNRLEMSSLIDNLLTNRWVGMPILLVFIWVMFQATFVIGSYPADLIEQGVHALGSFVSSFMPNGGILHDLIVDGVIAGVGGVIVFLPNIMILFLFMSFMEESGYMARAAFIMDKIMHNIGLHGKSFIPLLMGFGCNVPAILATRTLASRKDRIITMLLIPFMSCSARLPVFILLISIFFKENQGTVLLSLYAVGILMAICVALVLKRKLKIKEEAPFVMELPPYRMPTIKSTFGQMWDKASQYLRKMSTTILFASIIIWALGYFPRNNDANVTAATQLENSYIGKIGHVIEPVISPMGFDWKMGVSLLAGVGAKEVVVSTLSVLYNEQPDGELEGVDMSSALTVPNNVELEGAEYSRLRHNILNQRYMYGKHEGEIVFTPLVAYSFMLFILLYIPCIAVFVAIKKEGGTKWALFSVVLSISVAWIVSMAVYQIGSIFTI